MMNKLIPVLLIVFLIAACSENKLEKKGFSVSVDEQDNKEEGIKDTFTFRTRPRNVLFTKSREYRLTPVYKLNYNKKEKTYYTGSNYFHHNYYYNEYTDIENEGNNWNNNFMPGFSSVYGYNMVNISVFNTKTKNNKDFFEKPVLIKTLYYPASTNDTLNFQPISRNFYLVSVYDEDTNKDGLINVKDIRRFYHFDMNAENKTSLIPPNYSVMSSEYDKEIDYMYIFTRLDQNKNGQMEDTEDINIFWIDLKDPNNNGILY